MNKMNKLIEVILVPRQLLLKFYNMVSIEQLYLKTLIVFVLLVIGVSAWDVLHEET